MDLYISLHTIFVNLYKFSDRVQWIVKIKSGTKYEKTENSMQWTNRMKNKKNLVIKL